MFDSLFACIVLLVWRVGRILRQNVHRAMYECDISIAFTCVTYLRTVQRTPITPIYDSSRKARYCSLEVIGMPNRSEMATKSPSAPYFFFAVQPLQHTYVHYRKHEGHDVLASHVMEQWTDMMRPHTRHNRTSRYNYTYSA